MWVATEWSYRLTQTPFKSAKKRGKTDKGKTPMEKQQTKQQKITKNATRCIHTTQKKSHALHNQSLENIVVNKQLC